MFLVVGFILFGLFRQCTQNSQANASQYSYRPPPYNPNFSGNSYDSTTTPGFGTSVPNTHWRPGFWSGLGTGSLMSYLFRGRNNGYNTYNHPSSNYTNYGGPSTTNFPSSPSTSSPRTATAYATTRRR